MGCHHPGRPLGHGGHRRGAAAGWRDAAFSELDYAIRGARLDLNVAPADARAYMVRTGRHKYVYYEGFRPQLFDLQEDPDELTDLGDAPGHETTRAELHERLFAWLRARRVRVTITDAEIARRTNMSWKDGYLIGEW